MQNQHFLIMEEEDFTLRTDSSDGILGLGVSAYLVERQNISDYPNVPMPNIYGQTPIFKNIVEQGLVSRKVFSFYYAR